MASDGIRPDSHLFPESLFNAFCVIVRRGVQAQNPLFREVKTQLSSDLCGLNCRYHQVPHPHEVVGGGGERENPPDCFQSAMPSLT